MILRIVVLLYLCTASSLAMCVASSEDSYMEDVVLHDGRHLKVERTVKKVTEFRIRDPFFGLLPFFPRTEVVGTEFSLSFQHPDTHEKIVWKGKPNYKPLLLGVVDRVPYLVISGETSRATESIYGCPELPYFYLKYESGFFGNWSPVSVEKAPDVLRKSNISQPTENDGGYIQQVIPRTYEEWNYRQKNERLNERKFWDCRPPRAPLPQVVLPKAIEGLPEIIESIDYAPDRTVTGNDWSSLVFDKKREGECKKLFRPTDQNDHMQGQRFVNDNTGSKPAPYSKTAQFNMGVRVICDEHVWFVTHQEEPGKIVISRFTVTGDLMYRTSFKNPDQIPGFDGYIRIPTLRSEGGYLYFDWHYFRTTNREWHIKRWLKMRMREPAQIGNFQR